jgi:hypothetical protein
MKKIILSGIFTVSLIITLLTQLSFTQDKQEIKTIDSWGDIAIDDLHFIRATLRQNHAGPADLLKLLILLNKPKTMPVITFPSSIIWRVFRMDT